MTALAHLDAAFLQLETPAAPQNVVALLLLEPSAADISVDRIAALLLDRGHLLPALRMRVVEPPLGIGRPAFAEVSDFDPRRHIHHIHSDPPVRPAELDRIVASLASRPLDRSRPLWEVWLLDGLEGGERAIVFKLHHAIADGIAAAAFVAQLLDAEPTPPPALRLDAGGTPRGEPAASQPAAAPEQPLADRTRDLARKALAVARGVGEWTRAQAQPLGERPSWPLPRAPRSALGGRISAEREVARGSVSLDELRFIKKSFDVTLNDVLLAACTLALRWKLVARGAHPRHPLVAAVPISTRAGEDGLGGNRVSSLLVRLPVGFDNAEQVMEFLRLETRRAKQAHAVLGQPLLDFALELTPPGLLGWAARPRDLLVPQLCNLIISNVPGPQRVLYFAGVPVRAAYPLGPLSAGIPLNLTALSYRGDLLLGLLACPQRARDAQRLVDGIERAVGALRRGAERAGRR